MNSIIITKWNGHILTALFSERELVELGLEEENSILGNIYIGKVKNIVKNLNAAFVDFCNGQAGYYSLADNPVSLFPRTSSGSLKEGDEIVVQVEKEAVKAKDPVLTANLNFTGRYVVLTAGKTTVGFSAKISDKTWKESVKLQLEALIAGKTGVIVRTNAYGMDQQLLGETETLLQEFRNVMEIAQYRTCYSLLYEAEPAYLKRLKGCSSETIKEIITDDGQIFQRLENDLKRHHPENLEKLRLYEDPMLSLANLYSLEKAIEQACQKRVWLKSGGYLVIEPTEAMVVIDVNTGKYSGKKNPSDTIRIINLEAAREICRQLRIRNLSGIIMVDFIDMKQDADKELLMETLRDYAAQDPVKTTVVDMTCLNLVELTRKKEKRPLWEQLYKMKQGR